MTWPRCSQRASLPGTFGTTSSCVETFPNSSAGRRHSTRPWSKRMRKIPIRPGCSAAKRRILASAPRAYWSSSSMKRRCVPRARGALPAAELARHVRHDQHLRADVAQAQLGLRPEHAAVEVAHPEDPDPPGVLAGEGAHRRERATGELVVVVHEQEVRALRALDHRLARGVAEVLVAAATDEHLVARLELLRDALERREDRLPAAGGDDDGERDVVHDGIIRACRARRSSTSRTRRSGATTSGSSTTSSTATRRCTGSCASAGATPRASGSSTSARRAVSLWRAFPTASG